MNTVLMATDLSPRCEFAARRALMIARAAGAPLRVAHVVDHEAPEELRGVALRMSESEMRAALERAGAKPDDEVGFATLSGAGHRALLDYAREQGAGLLVVGTHRGASDPSPTPGSMIERLARHGRVPLLLVRDEPAGAYDHVMLGVDFSNAARSGLRMVRKLFPEAGLSLIHAFNAADAHRALASQTVEQVADLVREEFVRFLLQEAADLRITEDGPFDKKPRRPEPREARMVIEDGAVIAVLREQAIKRRPVLLAIGAHGRGGVARALVGSVAEDMLAWPPVDVLVTAT